ncbi:MAG TPA: tetratricopeptide repeat protein, partial [Anaerolineales bacterium]|nr:tetratricopeptide repeat protein [Anaerolineales bacterium]
MNVPPRRPLFNRRSESNLYRMFFWLLMVLGGVWLILQIRGGQIKSPFEAPPAPTRTSASYALEGDAQFTAGSIDKAIAAYQEAVRVDPNNAEAWSELARIQTYSSSLLTTDAERVSRLKESLQSATKATQLAPDDSTAHAVLAFALDWNADASLFKDDVVQQNLTQADQEALHALQLDPTNTLAAAYYSEILVDEQKWT